MGQSSAKIAAPCVFAIHELNEAILVYLPWQDLFALQRVNKTFEREIIGSAKLTKIMALHDLASNKSRNAKGASPLLWEFTWAFLNFELLPHESITRRGNDLAIKLFYDLWVPPRYAPRCYYGELGVGKQVHLLHRVDSRGTWRLLKLAAVPGKVWLHVNVMIHVAPSHVHELIYRDLIALKGETATFGDLADSLWEMKHRVVEEHLKLRRANELRVALRDLMDAKCIRGDSRERVVAVVAWDGGRPDTTMYSIAHRRETERRAKQERDLRRRAREDVEVEFSSPW